MIYQILWDGHSSHQDGILWKCNVQLCEGFSHDAMTIPQTSPEFMLSGATDVPETRGPRGPR